VIVTSLQKEGKILVQSCYVARGFFDRLKGLMFRWEIPKDFALAFPHCNSIHTFFMMTAIDVVFVSASGEVVDVIQGIKPWRLLVPRLKAKHVVEMRTGRSQELGIQKGQKLLCQGVWS